MRVHLAGALGLLALTLGCAREHISPSFGRATKEAMAMQQVNSTRPAPPPSMALDTQEAAVISKGYVQSLSGKAEVKEPQPILVVSPQGSGQGQAQQPLAPSVPKS